METLYKNTMLDAIPTPDITEIHLHSADPGAGDLNVITGVTISNIAFGAASSGQRVLTFDANVDTDGRTVAFFTIWDGANRITVGDPVDKVIDIADTLKGTHTFSL